MDGSRPESVGRLPRMRRSHFSVQWSDQERLCQNASSPTPVFRRARTSQGSGREGRGKKVAAIVIRIIRQDWREGGVLAPAKTVGVVRAFARYRRLNFVISRSTRENPTEGISFSSLLFVLSRSSPLGIESSRATRSD